MRAAGADGCRKGWVWIARRDGGAIDAGCAGSAAELIASVPRLRVLAIDVPIGLPESGARACDQQARALLGARRSSVFPAPLRGVLGAGSWAEACERGERIDGRRMSRQAWAITPKVREVDELLRARPGLRSRVCEVHPELSFRAWKREPLRHAKKTRAGHAERRALMDARFGADSFPDLRERFRRRDVADDDLLDAFAALWTAERVLRGEARTLPDPPPHDACGLPMRIVY